MTTVSAERAFTLSALWGPRRSCVDHTADLVLRFLAAIRSIDKERLGQWYELGWSRRDALSREIRVEYQAIRALVAREAQGSEPKLGVIVWLWNGASDEETISLSIGCGGTSQRVPNACVVELPRLGERTVSLLTTSTLVQLTRGIVDVFDPD